MLSPEVWDFNCPKSTMTVLEAATITENESFCNVIRDHYFNHAVSVVIPNCSNIPEDISKLLKDDCEYYRVQIPLSSLIEKEFIDAFINTGGEVTALSVNTRIDIEDCAALTPDGHLILSVNRLTFQGLGLEGTPWLNSSRSKPDKYGVCIDLKKDCFKPGKPNYNRVFESFKKLQTNLFDFIIAWEPHDKNICPSTIAKYFSEKGYDVRLCTPQFNYRVEQSVSVPSLKSTNAEDLCEWLGAFTLGVFKQDQLSLITEKYLSSYGQPATCTVVDKVVVFHWKGLFTTRKLLQLFNYLRDYSNKTLAANTEWISLNVQGFIDAPVSWKLKHNNYFNSSNNNYTTFIEGTRSRMLCLKIEK